MIPLKSFWSKLVTPSKDTDGPVKTQSNVDYNYDGNSQSSKRNGRDVKYITSEGTWTVDTWCLVVLVVLSAAVRLFRLGYPPAVVFDEFHFGKFVNWYCRGEYLFDIHPPLGKLVLWGIGKFLGYLAAPQTVFHYDKISQEYEHTLFLALRLAAVSFGTMIVPMCYLASRELGFSVWSSLISATFMMLDNNLIIESRLILVDSQLIFWCVCSIYCAAVLWKSRYEKDDYRTRLFWLVATACTAGLALSVKWTALAFPMVIVLESFFGLFFNDSFLEVWECALACCIGIGLYMFFFKVHFWALPHSGDGDGFMDVSFQKRLIGNSQHDASLSKRWFIHDFIELNGRMYVANKNITKRHPWDSRWFQWIVNWRGVLYYSEKAIETDELDEQGNTIKKTELVYLLGNPAVVWISGLCVLGFVLWLLFLIRYREKYASNTWIHQRFRIGIFLLFGWASNLAPYILVDRSSFLYHYLPGLFFGELLVSFMVDLLPYKWRPVVSCFVISVAVAAFLYWCPWIYAWPLTAQQHDQRRWMRRWD